jgi:hypothetical protein
MTPPLPGADRRNLVMTKPMTKTQLVAAVAEAMGADRKTATAALDAVASVVAREVVRSATPPPARWCPSLPTSR